MEYYDLHASKGTHKKMKICYFSLHNWTPGGGQKGHMK